MSNDSQYYDYFDKALNSVFGPSQEGSVASNNPPVGPDALLTPKQAAVRNATALKRSLLEARDSQRMQVTQEDIQRRQAADNAKQSIGGWVSGLGLDSNLAREGIAGAVEGTGSIIQAGGEALELGGRQIQRGLDALGLGRTPVKQAPAIAAPEGWDAVAASPEFQEGSWQQRQALRGDFAQKHFSSPEDPAFSDFMSSTEQQVFGRRTNETAAKPSDMIQNMADWVYQGADQIRAAEDPDFRDAVAASTPQGDITKPSTWSFGSAPSVEGYAGLLAGMLGQFAPQAATLLAGTPARVATAMSVVGGAQAGGSQAKAAEDYINDMTPGELTEASGMYRDLLASGLSPEEAKRQTATAAGTAAFTAAAPIGAVGGHLTHYIMGPLQKKLAGSFAGRAAKSTVLSAAEEGSEEALETVASRAATNQAVDGNQDVTEGTFGDFTLGALMGGTLGAPATVADAVSSAGNARQARNDRRQEASERQAQAEGEALQAAAQSGDVASFLDRSKPTYAPEKAVQALVMRGQQESATPDVRQESVAQANEIVEQMQADRDELAQRVNQPVAEQRRSLEKDRDAFKKLLEGKSEEEQAPIQDVIDGLEQDIADLDQGGEQSRSDRKAEQRELKRLDTNLERSRELLHRMTVDGTQPETGNVESLIQEADRPASELSADEAAPATKASIPMMITRQMRQDLADQGYTAEAIGKMKPAEAHAILTPETESTSPAPVNPAADRVIRLAMANPDLVSGEQAHQLAANTDNTLTDDQRSYLRSYADTRAAENRIKGIKGVRQDIVTGSKNYRGIADYRRAFHNAVASNRPERARGEIQALQKFTQQQINKARVLDSTFKQVKGTDNSVQLLPDKQAASGWKRAERPHSKNELAKRQGVEISVKSGNLVQASREEAKLLRQAVAELEAGYRVGFAENATESATEVAEPVASVETAEAPAQSNQAEPASPESVQGPQRETETSTQVSAGNPQMDNVLQRTAQLNADYPELDLADFVSATRVSRESLDQLRASLPAETMQQLTTLRRHYARARNGIESASTQETANEPAAPAAQAATETSVPEAAADTPQTAPQESSVDEPAATAQADPIAIVQEGNTATTEDTAPATLQVFRQPLTELATSTTEKVIGYGQDNPVARHFTQTQTADMPLTARGDFLADLDNDPRVANQYLNEAMSDGEEQLIGLFAENAAEWSDRIQALVKAKPEKSAAYRYEDLVQYLLDENGQLEPNVRTAISLGLFQWITEEAYNSQVNDDKAINAMLGRDSKARVKPKERALLAGVGVRQSFAANSMGRTAYQALGLKAQKGIPQNLRAQLESALGGYALGLALDLGLFERSVVSNDEFQALKRGPAERGLNNEGDTPAKRSTQFETQQFVKVRKQPAGGFPTNVQEMLDAAAGNRRVMHDLFGTESHVVAPSFTPIPFQQKTTKNTSMGIPKSQQEAMEIAQSRAHYIRTDMVDLIEQLPAAMVETMAGVEDLGQRFVMKAKQASYDGKNAGLQREIRYAHEWLKMLRDSENGLAQAFYFPVSVWKQQRVGIASNLFDIMGSKIHRHMTWMDGWETTVPVDENHPLFQQFLLSVADGLGVKTDKQRNEASLDQVRTKLASAANQAAIKALVKSLNGEVLETSDQNAIEAAVVAGGENFHSLDALLSYAHYQQALDGNATEFTARNMREVDGINNGPILANLQLGAAESVGELFAILNRGGIFPKHSPYTEATDWRAAEDHEDLYENAMQQVMGQVKPIVDEVRRSGDSAMRVAYSALFGIMGSPIGSDGKITSAGRKAIKTPVTAMYFGSGMATATASMGMEFVEKIYDKLEDLGNTEAGEKRDVAKAKLIRQVNALLAHDAKYRGAQLNPDMYWSEVQQLTLNDAQVAAVNRSYQALFGDHVQAAMQESAKQFIRRRDALNRATEAAYRIYQAFYDHARQQKIAELTAAGELATDAKGNPIQDLTREQEQEVKASIKDLEPIVHTALSRQDDQLDAGFFLAKQVREPQQNQAYRQKMAFAKGLGQERGPKGPMKGFSLQNAKYVYTDPGVSGLIMPIHSSDSAASIYSYSHRPAMNFHDANGFGLGEVVEGSLTFNEGLFKTMLGYSVPREMVDSLKRSVEALHARRDEVAASSALQKALRQAENALTLRMDDDSKALAKNVGTFWKVLNDATFEAAEAEQIKLDAMAQMAYVNQYGLEGASYQLTAADYAEIENQRKALKARSYTDALQQAREIKAAMDKAPTKAVPPAADTSLQGDIALDTTEESQSEGTIDGATMSATITAAAQEVQRQLTQKQNSGERLTQKDQENLQLLKRLSAYFVRSGDLDQALAATIPGDNNQARRNAWKNRLLSRMQNATPNAASITNVSNDEVLNVLESVLDSQEPGLRTATREGLELVRDEMIRTGDSLSSVEKRVPYENRAYVTAVLARAYSSNRRTIWGQLGIPAIDSNPALVEFFENTPSMTAGTLIQHLKRTTGTRRDEFNRGLLDAIERVIDKEMPIHYISADPLQSYRPQRDRNEIPSKARGWYESTPDGQAIYVKSPEYIDSGITEELMVHELLHAALADTIASAQVMNEISPHAPTEAQRLVTELDQLRQKAKAFIAADSTLKQRFVHAVKDVDELVSWGLSNEGFQTEVLEKISMESTTGGTDLVSGMKAFIQRLVGLLFWTSSKKQREQHTNGMGVLISNVSGLFHAAAQKKANRIKADVHPMMGPDIDAVDGYTTHQIFRALGRNGPTLSMDFEAHLNELLNDVINNLHGPFGVYADEFKAKQAVSADDVFLQSLAEGEQPFASASLAAGLPINDQEAFVIEQMEVSVREALNGSPVIYRQLAGLYREVKAQFHGDGREFHDGDWSQATTDERAEAKRRYDFIFRPQADNGDTSAYLSRFAALGLAWQPLHDKLGFTVSEPRRALSDLKFGEKLLEIFRRAMDFLNGKLTDDDTFANVDERVLRLTKQLVGIEAKKRRKLKERKEKDRPLSWVAEQGAERLADGIRAGIARVAGSNTVRNSKSGFVRFGGAAATLVATERTDKFMDALRQFRDQQMRKRHGLVMGMINEIQGPTKATEYAQQLLRAANKNEQERMQQITETAKLVREGFKDGGKHLGAEDKKALTRVLVRTDMAALLDHYSMAELTELVSNPKELDRAIAQFDEQLGNGGLSHYYRRQAKDLAYYMATGHVRSPNLMTNAHGIAYLAGTSRYGSVTDAQAEQAIATLDPLISLLALKYVPQTLRVRAQEVMRTELPRGTENGAEGLLRLHRAMQQDSLENLFDGDPAHVVKGYTREIYNPYTSVKVATGIEAVNLKRQGWSQGDRVPADPHDPDTATKHLFAMRDGGLKAHITGIMSYSGERAKGSTVHGGITSFDGEQIYQGNVAKNQAIWQAKSADIDALFQADPGYHPATQKGSHMAPVLNRNGEVVNYRYLMNDNTKDTLLERNNSVDDVMGAMAGRLFDMPASQQLNEQAVKAMYDQYRAEYVTRPQSYIRIGPNAPDKANQEIWRLMPDETKKAVKRIWGSNEMLVRADLMDIAFGYRKYSLANMFEKPMAERNLMEKMFSGVFETAYRAAGFQKGYQGEELEQYVKRAQHAVRRSEDVWQEIMKQVKDILVVKSGITLLGNIASNLWQLHWHGVPAKEIIRNHRVALEGAIAYRRDSDELTRLEKTLAANYVTGDQQTLRDRIVELKDSLARNPVHELMEAGLMQTIVEDIDTHQDQFSYLSVMGRKTQKLTGMLPAPIRTAAKWAYMTHDTPLYKALNQGTQLSDFLARYTLHQHQTGRRNQPMSVADSIEMISEAFVNYDVPTQRTLQYLNDMGIWMFTKYYLRIQRVIARLFRQEPGRAMMMLTVEHFFPNMPTIMDAHFLDRIGDNPFSDGALMYPGSLDELATVRGALSFF